ncbi:helix-turn-helix transcriptional regulator [Vitiosangium sp. GDMCC 1.1324]|uniref:helix-turn-helix transcriptional regulator n=1 Tax=Vitiosangium sp. (strain GDMCC 1.1324) TaxID=2138576 RepID=UPI001E3159D0|nr:helix-turn-helix domain-containing protein [Vitiosangium sp. GDMCC 1.1324]
MQIGNAARTARLSLDLTQEDVAERIGVAAEVYGRLERGKLRPSTPTLVRLSKALGTPVDVLIGLAAGENETAHKSTEAAPGSDMTPEFRRVRRAVRTMNRLQLSTFWRLVDVLATHNRKLRDSHRKARETTT